MEFKYYMIGTTITCVAIAVVAAIECIYKPAVHETINLDNTVTINGVEYEQVKQITITNHLEKVTLPDYYKNISLCVNGDIKNLITTKDVHVSGNVSNIKTTTGHVQVDGSCFGNIISKYGNVITH